MATVKYTLTGTYIPFLVILRDIGTNLPVDSSVVQSPNVEQEFTDVPDGDYIVEVYDTANGEKTKPIIIPTTTLP